MEMDRDHDYIRVNDVLLYAYLDANPRAIGDVLYEQFPTDDQLAAVMLPEGAARLWGWLRDEVDSLVGG